MIPPDLHSQMLRMLDGELSSGELAALEAELEENPEAREAWQKLARLHSALEVHYESRANVSKMPVVPIDRVLARQRRWIVKTSVLAAAALLVISGVALWMVMAPATRATLAAFHAAPNSVFMLSHSGDGEKPMGNVLAEGSRVVLEHGVAELQLPHEVLAIVEAPAAITLLDERTLRLDKGRAFFHVPSEKGRGFTVVTRHQQIVDLGTAFGIDARSGRDEVELHVFEGRVRIDHLEGEKGEIISATRSVLLAGARVLKEINGPPVSFRRKLPAQVKTLLLEDFESGLLGGRDYAARIDPGAIRDLAGNPFEGIDNDETWSFRAATPSTVKIPVQSYVYDGGNPPSDQPSDFESGLLLDPDHSKLTDGNPGVGPPMKSGDYVGFRSRKNVRNLNPQVTFDLGLVHDVETIVVMLQTMYSRRPESVNVSVSTNGEDFSAPVSLTPRYSGSGLVKATLDLSTWAPARYYRLNFVYSTGFAFLGEVEFNTVISPPPTDDLRILLRNVPAPEADPDWSDHDDSPPVLVAMHPAAGATETMLGGRLVMVFDKPVKFGTGRIILRNLTDWNERQIVVGGPRTSIEGRVVTVIPPADLPDGDISVGPILGWESVIWTGTGLLNPRGDGSRYRTDELRDSGRSHGILGSMRGPAMATFGGFHRGGNLRREIAMIAPDSRYSVTAAIGVRADDADRKATFTGYTIRLTSGDTVLAELSSNTPPGPPNSVTSVGFSWDSSALPAGVEAGHPLAIEIASHLPVHPGLGPGPSPGYLDVDNVRVTVVGE